MNLPLWLAVLGCASDPGPRDKGDPSDPSTQTTPTTPTSTFDDDGCLDDLEQFTRDVSPVLQSDCITCHVAGGLAANTRHVLLPNTEAGHLDANFATLTALALDKVGDDSLVLLKVRGDEGHGGGQRFASTDPVYLAFTEMVGRAEAPGGCDDPDLLPPTCEPGAVNPAPAPLRRLTDVQVGNALFDLLGVRPSPGTFPVTEAGENFSTWPDANVVSASGADGILMAAEEVAAAATTDLVGLTGCEPATETCARAWAHGFVDRAYRRPLLPEELAIVDVLFDTGEDVADSVGRVIELVVQSPQFLYLDTGAAGPVDGRTDVAQLTDHAIASRLSFALLDTTPPADLRAAADAGALHTRAQVFAWARRLLDDPRMVPVVARFHRDWLHTYQLATIAKDPVLYPQFDEALVDDMLTELDLFTTEVVWLGDGTFDALIGSTTSWTVPSLDAVYELPAGSGAWERRELGPERPGVLGRAAFLTAHSYSATSSPVRRGAFVLEQMLCEERTPPPGVDLDIGEPTETNTIRDRLAAHRADPSCAACHDRMDPIGYSMEHFGALGEWRDDWENGIPVDASGELEDPDGTFVGMAQMLTVLDQGDQVRDCYAQKWFEYVMGRAAIAQDQCTLDAIGDRFAHTGGDLRDLLAHIAASDAMRVRTPAVLEDPS